MLGGHGGRRRRRRGGRRRRRRRSVRSAGSQDARCRSFTGCSSPLSPSSNIVSHLEWDGGVGAGHGGRRAGAGSGERSLAEMAEIDEVCARHQTANLRPPTLCSCIITTPEHPRPLGRARAASAAAAPPAPGAHLPHEGAAPRSRRGGAAASSKRIYASLMDFWAGAAPLHCSTAPAPPCAGDAPGAAARFAHRAPRARRRIDSCGICDSEPPGVPHAANGAVWTELAGSSGQPSAAGMAAWSVPENSAVLKTAHVLV
jgi:hypothetical protein